MRKPQIQLMLHTHIGYTAIAKIFTFKLLYAIYSQCHTMNFTYYLTGNINYANQVPFNFFY